MGREMGTSQSNEPIRKEGHTTGTKYSQYYQDDNVPESPQVRRKI
jgi:hypothetical protein